MGPDEIRRRILETVERGELPRGGPSELAARDLIESAPDAYWERWSADAADCIRAQAKAVRCCCPDGRQPARDGRCERCWVAL